MVSIQKIVMTRPGTPGADGGLASVSADTSPTLGGDLDLAGHAIPGVTDAVAALNRPHHVYAETSASITTGSSDIATPLQALLNAYKKVEFRGQGTYLTGPLIVPTATTLIIPEGVTLKLKNGAEGYPVTVEGTGRVVGEGTIDGNRANQDTTAHGCVYVSANGRVKGVTVINAPGSGVVLGGIGAQATNVRVEDCDTFGILSNNSRQLIQGCTVEDTGAAGIRATGYTATGNHGTRVLGNDVSQSSASIICIEIWGESAGALTRTVVSTNTTDGGSMGISLSTLYGGSCVGNTVTGFASVGIELASCQHCAVGSNTVNGEGAASTNGISASNSGNSYNAITGNTILNCIDAAIKIYQGSRYSVTGNIIDGVSKSTAVRGIWVQSASHVAVTGNVIANISYMTSFEDTGNITFTGNDLITGDYGFATYNPTVGTIDNITITGNVFTTVAVPIQNSGGSGTLGSNIVIRSNPGVNVDYLDYANNVQDRIVTATPESSITAGVGSVARDRTNGVVYVKETGTGNTGWAAVTT